MQKEELKKRAQSIVQIPPHFKPVIEDILENDPVQGEGIFTWVNEAREEEYIDLTLDLKGNLLHLSIDKKVEDIINNPLNEREKREIAEGFLGYHYPDALKSLTLSKVRNQTYDDIFYFEQMVMDLPLPNAGCTIVIDHWGDVTGFTYEGIKAIPEIPATLISKEKLVADLQTRLDFKLVVMQPEEGGFRLVYEPTTECMDFKAGVLEPTLTIIHEEDVVPKIVPLPILANPPRVSASIEEIIGISEDMEIIRETELCDERGVVWRWKNWVGKEQDLTLNSFFANHNDDTVKAFIHKETGKVTRFIWFYKRNGELQLTREECFARAVDFLCRMVPEYCPYLQLVVREDAFEDEDEDEPNTISGFTFWLHNGHGIPIQSEIVMVGVNRTTGQIDHYSGLHMKPEQLQQIPTEPVISKEEARERFMEHLDFKLAWSWYYDNQNESYILAYEACDSLTQTFIEYIDAITGDVITYKNPF